MEEERIKLLINKYLANTLTEDERRELDEVLQNAPKVDTQKNLELTMGMIHRKRASQKQTQRMIGGGALLIVAVSVYLLWPSSGKDVAVEKTQVEKALAAPLADVLPGSDKATLTLADGRRIRLDSIGIGAIQDISEVKVTKQNSGALVYSGSKSIKQDGALVYNSSDGISMHTLEAPRAGKFMVQLPDGSKVWLNNASSLRYPTSFTGTYREVELTGEAYFDIAKDPSHPFRAKVDGKAVDVLGTSFIITAYKEDKKFSTTLVTGKVQVSDGVTNQILRPGQALNIRNSRSWEVQPKADTAGALAWKNGYFHFKDEGLTGVLRQLGRWYDVDIESSVKDPKSFNDEINRNQPLSHVLKALGLIYRLEEKRIIITGEDISHDH